MGINIDVLCMGLSRDIVSVTDPYSVNFVVYAVRRQIGGHCS
jgi:hypothetical protein